VVFATGQIIRFTSNCDQKADIEKRCDVPIAIIRTRQAAASAPLPEDDRFHINPALAQRRL
jgi:hypothetical protein